MASPITTASVRQAMLDAITEAMADDESVVLLAPGRGDPPPECAADPAHESGHAVDPGRVLVPPSDAVALGALCAGAAAGGLRPVLDLTAAADPRAALSQVESVAAGMYYRTGGQARCPLVCCVEASAWESPFARLVNAPGLKAALLSGDADIRALVLSAIRDPNPVVLVVEDTERIGGVALAAPADDATTGRPAALGPAAIRRTGTDVTLVAIGAVTATALAVAGDLGGDGISAEVVEIRTLAPLDVDTVLESVSRTGRLVVCEDAPGFCSVSGEIVASVAGVALPLLKAPPRRVTREHTPRPGAPGLRERVEVTERDVRAAVRHVMGPYAAM
ncbi:transketolase C-terminal domain-containing protein [Streptantibioticus parmotrematis]|uniref:transketolase C-terminal domain-containing protein n=1 Tax=Streptantibioticus parmotrematis TaxID=2873249 RepID=UPI0033EF89A2